MLALNPGEPRRLGVLVGLFLFVCVLGLVQYRWIDQLAQARRQSAQTSSARAFSRFETDFDFEITRAFRVFQMPMRSDYDARYREWSLRAPYPELIRGIYILERKGGAFAVGPVEPDEPPLRLGSWAQSLPDRPMPGIDPILTVEGNPAFLIPAFERRGFALPFPLPPPNVGNRWVLVVLDTQYIENAFLRRLIRADFPTVGSEQEYDLAVVDFTGGTKDRVVFTSERAPEDEFLHSEEAGTFFELRPDCFTPAMQNPVGPPSRPIVSRDLLTDILAQTASSCGSLVASSDRRARGRWEMLIRYKAGSLDRAVAAFRYRNLLLSGAVLLVLFVGGCVLIASAERTRALAAMKTEFVLGVSHELRTPLTVIQVAADNLTKGLVESSDSARKYGEIIQAKASELSGMVEETLTFGRLESMPFVPQAALSVLAPQEIVLNALAKCGAALRAGSIEVEQHITSDALLVRVDRPLVQRSIENLIQNATKYAAAGRWIAIHLDRERRPGAEFVCISVHDRGPGITSADLPHIFEPFYRGKAAEISQVPGVGLGLALVKGIVESHGGAVEITNAVTGGTIASIFLPLYISDGTLHGSA